MYTEDVLPAPSEAARLHRGYQLGTIFCIDFKGDPAEAKVCEFDNIGHDGGSWQRVVVVSALSFRTMCCAVSTWFFLAGRKLSPSSTCTWRLLESRHVYPQENNRHITAWSMLLGIACA